MGIRRRREKLFGEKFVFLFFSAMMMMKGAEKETDDDGILIFPLLRLKITSNKLMWLLVFLHRDSCCEKNTVNHFLVFEFIFYVAVASEVQQDNVLLNKSPLTPFEWWP
jgi:hypothetical protein